MIPLTIIAGFLGSGKTSLLQNILSENKEKKIAALVNDFGKLSIDAELISREDATQITLANGCICCSINDDLARALVQALNATPDHIIIEASGVADPARIALFAEVDPALRLDGIICVIDAHAHAKHAHDNYLADTYDRQLACADLFLINKTDLVDSDTLTKIQNELPDKPQICIAHGKIDNEIILNLATLTLPTATPEPESGHGLRQWAAHLPPIGREAIQEKIKTLTPELIRAKGILKDEAGAYIIQYAGGRINIAAYDGTPSGHFVLIGKPNLPDDETLSRLFAE